MSNSNSLHDTQEISPPEDYPSKFATFINANSVFQKLISLQAKLENILNRLHGIQEKTEEIHTEILGEEEMDEDEETDDEEEIIPSKKRKI